MLTFRKKKQKNKSFRFKEKKQAGLFNLTEKEG
jgi:hypothetical protein